MKRTLLCFLFLSTLVLAQKREIPRHLFHPDRPLSEASTLPAQAIAGTYLRTLAQKYTLTAQYLDSLYVVKEYRTAHNGVTHLVYRQNFNGIDIYNSEWTVNIDQDGRVLNSGGSLFHASDLPAALPTLPSAHRAVRAAVRAINPKLGETFYPLELDVRDRGKHARFHKGGLGEDVYGSAVWYVYNGALQPAWAFSMVDADKVNSYEVVVETNSDSILEKQPLTWFQNAAQNVTQNIIQNITTPAQPRGMVYEAESPQVNRAIGVQQTKLPSYLDRTLQSFAGDPAASPKGWVSGTATAGNNVIAGENREAVFFLTDPKMAQSFGGDFNFPLQLGLGAPSPVTFPEAVTTNLFYWANKAHDLHYAAGFDEQAGAYQQDNFGRGGAAGDPMYAYTHFGATDTVFADLNNSFYTTRSEQDGSPSMIAMFLASFGGTVFTDGALDAGVIVHEYTHGVSTRLVRQLGGAQGGAMGEAWSDFFGMEYTLPEGTPIDGAYPVGEYFAQAAGTGIRTHPYSTDLNVNPLTYARLGQVISRPEIHADGEIWVEALWEARAALIRQFGEKEGRRRIRLLVMDGMKLCPPAPTMVDARDAILLADRADFQGQSQTPLWAAFARRGLGALAQSTGTNSTHVAASFDVPSSTGKIGFYEDNTIQGDAVRIVVADTNLDQPAALVQVTSSSGDLEDLWLARTGTVYTGVLGTATSGGAVKRDGRLSLIPGDFISAYYLDSNAGGVAKLIDATVPTKGTYSLFSASPDFTFGNETALRFRAAPRSFQRYDLPFDFPFFGRNYRSLRLYNNGLLVFDLPPAPTCIDAAGLSAYAAIAPLWMELRTSGSAQNGEDVYVSRTGDDAITFRWVAETAPPAATGVDSVPVNFSATLYADGRIRFNYGSENLNLAAPSANSSCGDSAPVVGIASGTGYVYSVGGYSRVPKLQNAPSLLFNPPYGFSSIPTGQLDSPVEGQSFQGILSGSGVVYDSDSSVSAVYVLVDGLNVGQANLRVARADFCAAQKVNGCPNVGFTFNFDIAARGLAPGNHTLLLRAVNARYAFTDIPEKPLTIQIAAGAGRLPKGAIETPKSDAEVSGSTAVKGYVYIEGSRILNVDLLIDGVTYANLPLTQRRDDICAGLANVPNCPAAGFSLNLNTVAGSVPLPNGPHLLQIRVLDQAGRFSILPETAVAVTVNNSAVPVPLQTLTSPSNNDKLSGTVHISGMAYDPAGAIMSASLMIDGESRAAIPYGTSRAAECAQLPDVKACPNIGFDLDFDTRVLTNGSHVLGVRLVNKSGQASTILGPAGGLSYGINVIVQN